MNYHVALTEVKQLGYFACSLEVTLPLGVDSWEWLKVPDHHPCPSLQRYSFIFNLPVLSCIFCPPFLRHGANPTENRPPVMMLVFSDASEFERKVTCSSYIGAWVLLPPPHSALHPTIACFQIKDFICSGFIKGPRVYDIYLVAWCLYIPTKSSGEGWTSIYTSHQYNM